MLRKVVGASSSVEVRVGVGLEPRVLLAAVSDVFSDLETSVISLRLPLSLQLFFPANSGGYSVEVRGDQQLTALMPSYAFRAVSVLFGFRL